MTAARAFPPVPSRAASALRAGIRSAGDAVAPWLDLAMRLWLAPSILTRDVLDAMHGTAPAMAGSGAMVAAVNHLVASPTGVLIQALCPFLLLLGLGSRFAATALLVQVVLLRGPDAVDGLFLSWALLLGWTVVVGPGPVSLDALLGRGLDASAVPGSLAATRAFSWITRRLGPAYQLLVRLWVAAVFLARAGLAPEGGEGLGTGLPWLGDLPDHAGLLPAIPSLLVGALLALGFGTRVCTLALLLAVALGHPGLAMQDRLFWALLLGVLACAGPGPLALDALVARAAEAAGRRMLSVDGTLPHVVVLGGGFGGVAAARGLRGAPCRVTVVDRNNHHVFQPLLYQVATAGLSPAAIATPIRSLFRTQANVSVSKAGRPRNPSAIATPAASPPSAAAPRWRSSGPCGCAARWPGGCGARSTSCSWRAAATGRPSCWTGRGPTSPTGAAAGSSRTRRPAKGPKKRRGPR